MLLLLFSSSVAQLCPTLCDPMVCSMPGLPVLHHLPRLAQCPLSQWCHPTISSSVCLILLSSVFPSIRVYSSESVIRIRWPKYWSLSFSISPSNEYSGLFSFRIDWFGLLDVQGIPKTLLQHHNWKASIVQRSAFFMIQLLHLYMTTGETIALTMLDLCQQSDVFEMYISDTIRYLSFLCNLLA